MWKVIFIFGVIICEISSQTVWIDIDTGKVLGVSNQNQNRQPVNNNRQPVNNNRQPSYPNYYQNQNYGQYHNQQQRPNNQQFTLNNQNSEHLNAEWVCRNSKTGETMLIASEIGNRNQGQSYNHQNINPNNPWLNGQVPSNNQQQNWNQNAGETTTPQNVFIVTTSKPPVTSTKSPFPTINVNWENPESNTRKPGSNSALDGEGIIQPRINTDY